MMKADLVRHARLFLTFAAAATLAACAGKPPPADPPRVTPQIKTERPHYPGFGEAIGKQPLDYTIESLAGDFEELLFFSEWGSEVEVLRKWPGPVRVALFGKELQKYRPETQALLDRIHAEAPEVQVTLSDDPDAEIGLRVAPRHEMDRIAPGALCFFVPLSMGWDDYTQAEVSGEDDWDEVTELTKVTVFIPEYGAPHEIRSCILEEVMQALGPSNDLYRIEDTIFNDDGAHEHPTSFDMLMLRVLFNPALEKGMTQEQARAAARKVLADLITEPGETRRFRRSRDRSFNQFLRKTYSEDNPTEQQTFMKRLIRTARGFGKHDHRFGFAQRGAGYLDFHADKIDDAIEHFRKASDAQRIAVGENSLRRARIRTDLALALMEVGRNNEALTELNAAEPILAAYGYELELAYAFRLKANALYSLKRKKQARKTADQALKWAAYSFGADSDHLQSWREEFAENDAL